MLVVPSAATHAQLHAEPDERHLLAVQRMLRALRLGELTLRGLNAEIERDREKQPAVAAFMQDLLREATTDAVETRMATLYARHITREHAEEAARFFETDVGRRIINHTLAAPPAQRLSLPPEDARAESQFSKTIVGRAVETMFKIANPQVGALMRNWTIEIAKARQQQDPEMFATLARATEANVLNKIREVAQIHMRTLDERQRQYIDAATKYQIETFLLPVNLATIDINRGNQHALDILEKELVAYLRSVGAVQQAMADDIKRIDTPESAREEFLRGFERGLARSYDLMIRYGENQRRSLDLIRRMLTLVERSNDRIRLDSGQLIFAEEADLVSFRSLARQLQDAAAEESAIEKESASNRQRAVDVLRLGDGRAQTTDRSPDAGMPQPDTSAHNAHGDLARPAPSARRRFATIRSSEQHVAQYVRGTLARIKSASGLVVPDIDDSNPVRTATITVSVRADGSIERVVVNQPRNDLELSRRIEQAVRRAAPIERFPADLHRDVDVLSITVTVGAEID
jgi:protein TonB